MQDYNLIMCVIIRDCKGMIMRVPMSCLNHQHELAMVENQFGFSD